LFCDLVGSNNAKIGREPSREIRSIHSAIISRGAWHNKMIDCAEFHDFVFRDPT
jgi:hypothetical protein